VRRADKFTPSHADCLEIWERQPPGTSGPVQTCNRIALPLFTIIIIITAIELSLGDSSPYTRTDKTNNNKYT
jgi:hypothetical protein